MSVVAQIGGCVWTAPLEKVADGGLTLWTHNEDRNTQIFGDGDIRPCAYGGAGCPAVMLIEDRGNTIISKQWQYFIVGINYGMSRNNIANLLKKTTALTNETDPTAWRNYIMGENLNAKEDPKLDKFRTFSRNTHAAEFDGNGWRLVTMDGNNPPPLKPGKVYPQRLEDIEPDDYLYHPRTHPHLFLVCNNVEVKGAGQTSVFPFAHGLIRYWLDDEPYTFFPFVSVRPVYLNTYNWTMLEPSETPPHPYRRVS